MADETSKRRNSSDKRDIRLAERASQSFGVIDRRDLRDCGLGRDDVHYRVQTGRLHPLFRGTWSVGHRAMTREGWFYAAVRSTGGDSRISGISAVQNFGLFKGRIGEIHVTTRRRPRPQPRIRIHSVKMMPPRAVQRGIPTVSVEQAILDCATQIRSDRALLRIAKNALVDDLTTHERLLEHCERSGGTRGVVRLRGILALGGERTRSTNEDEALAWLRSVGLQPEVNAQLHGQDVDLWLPGLGTVIEVDGSVHDNPLARAEDARRTGELELRGVRVIRVRGAR